MSNSLRAKTYTKTARWYNLPCLMLTMISSISVILSTALNGDRTEILTIEMFRSVAILLAGILGIAGIAHERIWAKWLAMFTYGLSIVTILEAIVNSFSAEAAINLLIHSSVLNALRVIRFTAIVVLLVGVVLLFKHPPSSNSLAERSITHPQK